MNHDTNVIIYTLYCTVLVPCFVSIFIMSYTYVVFVESFRFLNRP